MEGDSEGDGTPIFDAGDVCAAAPAAASTPSLSPRPRTRSLSPELELMDPLPLLKSPSVIVRAVPQCTFELLVSVLEQEHGDSSGGGRSGNGSGHTTTLHTFFGSLAREIKPTEKASFVAAFMLDFVAGQPRERSDTQVQQALIKNTQLAQRLTLGSLPGSRTLRSVHSAIEGLDKGSRLDTLVEKLLSE